MRKHPYFFIVSILKNAPDLCSVSKSGSIPKSLEPLEGRPKITLSDVLRNIPVIKRRAKESGCWPFDTDEFIIKLLKGEMSLDGPLLQAILLDWMESEDYYKFLNLGMGETIFAQSAKRGNVVYATRKTKKRDALKNAMDGKVFDYPVKGFRNRRMMRLLLCTVNFDRSLFTCEEAWAALRSTPIEGLDYTYNVINKLNANISKIFGKHGTLTSKEAQSSGYPAPHLIFILDEPVMVQRHVGRDGKVSWRICDQKASILMEIRKGRSLCDLTLRVSMVSAKYEHQRSDDNDGRDDSDDHIHHRVVIR